MEYIPYPNAYFDPVELQTMTVECSNPLCGMEVSWEDAVKDDFGNWVCDACADGGWKSADAIFYTCELDDDEIAARSYTVDVDMFYKSGSFTCPVCGLGGKMTSVYGRNMCGRNDNTPHHECACYECSEVFYVYLEEPQSP